MVDFFAGRLGWSKIFASRGWKCYCFDLIRPPEIPSGCVFIEADMLNVESFHFGTGMAGIYPKPVFGVCSSPCEEFSVWGMRHFHPNPPYPYGGIKLFEHSRQLLTELEIPFVMENVRAAQQFVGNAVHHCGPFFLWGNAVPPLLHKGITKGIDVGSSKLVKRMSVEEKRTYRAQFIWNQAWSSSKQRKRDTAKAATIPRELASCVAQYAERVIEQRVAG